MQLRMKDLGKDIIFASGQVPELVLVCGPCRNGTTALANNFTVAGMESHMQPMKSILRANGHCALTDVTFDSPDVVLVKETFGAEFDVELFDPIDILLNAGYPPNKIKVIGMVREPVAAYDSWLRLWGKVDYRIFDAAYRLMASIHDRCIREQIAFLPYVPEAIIHNEARHVIRMANAYLGLQATSNMAANWNGAPKFGDQDQRLQHLHFYDEPPARFIEGVREWGGYVFRDTTMCRDHVVPEASRETYNRFRLGCERMLGIAV